MKKYSFKSFLDTLENTIFFQMPKSTTYNDATWMETLNYVSMRPSLPTTFYGFHFGAVSYEKMNFKVKAIFFNQML